MNRPLYPHDLRRDPGPAAFAAAEALGWLLGAALAWLAAGCP